MLTACSSVRSRRHPAGSTLLTAGLTCSFPRHALDKRCARAMLTLYLSSGSFLLLRDCHLS